MHPNSGVGCDKIDTPYIALMARCQEYSPATTLVQKLSLDNEIYMLICVNK